MKSVASFAALIVALSAPLTVQAQPAAQGFREESLQERGDGDPVIVTVYAPPVLVTITRSAGDPNNDGTFVIASTPSSPIAIIETPASKVPSSVLSPSSTPSVAATKTPSTSQSPGPDPKQSSTTIKVPLQTGLTSVAAQSSSKPAAITSSPAAITSSGGNGGSGGPGSFTIAITNSYGSPLSIGLGWNSDGAAPDGDPQPTVLASKTQYTFPTHWAGRISIGKTLCGSNSLIEGSFQGDEWTSIDVSYVDGYSVPITCSIAGKAIAGCNLDLWDQDLECKSPVEGGAACHNSAGDYGPVLPFFAACEKAAYTFPKDDEATFSAIQGKRVDCCIGTSCPSPPSQKASKRDFIPSRPHGHKHHARHLDPWRSSRSHVHQLVQEAKLRR